MKIGLTEAEQQLAADIFTQHQPFIESVARKHATHSQDVQDVVQAVGMNLCKGLKAFRGESHIRTWLYRVTANAARDHYRAEQRHIRKAQEAIQAHPQPEAHEPNPDESLSEAAQQARLEAAIQQLRPEYQTLIRNKLGAGAVLTDQKARVQLMRAKRELRAILSPQ